MTPPAFLERLWRERAIAIVRAPDAEQARGAMEAAIAAGLSSVEVTLNTPGALPLVRDLARRDGLVVGAGTVMTPEDARAAVDAGARFLVSPIADDEVMRAGVALGVAVAPGGSTPSELVRAHRAGAHLQKLFPAPAGGPAWVRACLGPLPFLRLVPTSGVDESNAADYLEAGAFAVGLTRALFDPADMAQHRFDRIEERGRRLRALVHAAPRPPRPAAC